MAKTRQAPAPEKAPPATPAERAADEIRRFHALGRRVLERAEDDGIPKHRAARLVSDEEGVSFDRARKAVRFAALSDSAMEGVCSLSLTEERPLSVAHVRRVLGLKRRSDWSLWLKRAAKCGWSADRLELALNREAAMEKSGTGGPRIRMPADLLDALRQVIVQSDEWLKRYAAIWQEGETWRHLATSEGTDRGAARVRLKQARARLKRLREGATSLEEQLAKIDRVLKRKPGPAGQK
jgi:hypothetical protein